MKRSEMLELIENLIPVAEEYSPEGQDKREDAERILSTVEEFMLPPCACAAPESRLKHYHPEECSYAWEEE